MRAGDNIKLELENVFLSSEHPQSIGGDTLFRNCTLKIFSVESEKAIHWNDDRAEKEHPELSFP
ncbi:MAG: hypothetical protein ACI9SP_003140 [Arenicella sp.]